MYQATNNHASSRGKWTVFRSCRPRWDPFTGPFVFRWTIVTWSDTLKDRSVFRVSPDSRLHFRSYLADKSVTRKCRHKRNQRFRRSGGGSSQVRQNLLSDEFARWPREQQTGKDDIPFPVVPASCFEPALECIQNSPVRPCWNHPPSP